MLEVLAIKLLARLAKTNLQGTFLTMKNILYHFQIHNKVNGILFYCFQYYVFLKERDKNTVFTIYNISEADLKFVKNVFLDRYVFNTEYLDDIISIDDIGALDKQNYGLSLMFDVNTFKKTYSFIKNDIQCYSNTNHQMVRSRHKNITYYGYYEYQPFDIKTKLKFYFDIYRKIENPQHGLFINCKDESCKIDLPDELKNMRQIRKRKTGHYDNFFSLFDTIYYFQTVFDLNNRIIPECFYYKKNIFIKYNESIQDSLNFRYNDIRQNGLGDYILTCDDPIIRD